MLLRQQEYEHRMAHHSGSRSDLLDHDHTAAIYEHGLATTAYPGNNQPYTFVRMCDGKFVRTAIPLHDFEAVDSASAAGIQPTSQSGYYRSSVNHTLRRPSKRHAVAAAAAPHGSIAGHHRGHQTLRPQRPRLPNQSCIRQARHERIVQVTRYDSDVWGALIVQSLHKLMRSMIHSGPSIPTWQ